jgi:hypothetical protein
MKIRPLKTLAHDLAKLEKTLRSFDMPFSSRIVKEAAIVITKEALAAAKKAAK